MREQFTDLTLKPEGLERLEIVGGIIDEYLADGYKLTLRQLYYQLVSRDIIPNAQNEYDKLGVLLVKGRMAGGDRLERHRGQDQSTRSTVSGGWRE